MNKRAKDRVRAAIRQCEQEAQVTRLTRSYRVLWYETMQRLDELAAQSTRRVANRYYARMDAVKPLAAPDAAGGEKEKTCLLGVREN